MSKVLKILIYNFFAEFTLFICPVLFGEDIHVWFVNNLTTCTFLNENSGTIYYHCRTEHMVYLDLSIIICKYDGSKTYFTLDLLAKWLEI